MTNKEFINMLVCCNRIGKIDNNIMLELMNCDIDLSKAYREVSGLIKNNGSVLSSDTILLNTFYTVLKYYKRKDKTKNECFNEFIRLLKLKLTILCEGNLEDIYMLANEGITGLPLFRDLRFFRIKEVSKGSMIVLNGKPSLCNVYYNEDKSLMQFYIDRKQTDIGGIFIKDGIEHYFEVKDKRDSRRLMKEIIKGDYDLALVPYLRMLKNINNSQDYNFNNIEILRYMILTLSDYTTINDVIRESYDIVADYDINLKDLLSYAYHWRSLNISVLVEFLGCIIQRIKGLSYADRRKYLREVYEILFVKLHMISPINIQKYGDEHFRKMIDIFNNERLNSKECLEAIKKEKKENVISVYYHGQKRHEDYSLLIDRVIIDDVWSKREVLGNYRVLIDKDKGIHILTEEDIKDKEYLLLIE